MQRRPERAGKRSFPVLEMLSLADMTRLKRRWRAHAHTPKLLRAKSAKSSVMRKLEPTALAANGKMPGETGNVP